MLDGMERKPIWKLSGLLHNGKYSSNNILQGKEQNTIGGIYGV